MMKKIAMVAALLVSSSCFASETPLEVVQHYMGAWNQHNAHKAGTYLAKDVTYYDAAVGTPVKGNSDAEKNVIKAFIDGVPDLKWQMVGKPVYNHDIVAFEWVFSGVNSGEWAGSPATNKPIKFHGVSYIKVEDGKIVYQGDYYDSKKLDEQLK